MSNSLHNELRKEFQLERMILFSDAVFAIAITLLVIEIKIPGFEEMNRELTDAGHAALQNRDQVTDHQLLHALGVLVPKFIGFLISFLLIGQYWIVHHRMYGYVINFNSKLIWLNLLFLLGVALMPFSTGFYSEYAGANLLTPIIFYTANIAWLGLLNFILWRYLGNVKNGMTENMNPELSRYSAYRSLTVPVIFILCCYMYTVAPLVASFVPASIPLIIRFVFGPWKKKLLQKSK